MHRPIGIGYQDFEEIRAEGIFYIDKTDFIREWWENADKVTLIARQRRFGKTLNMSMLEKFFSTEYAGRHELFEGLRIWDSENYRKLQGTYPVISLSFANVEEKTYAATVRRIGQILTDLYSADQFLLDDGDFDDKQRRFFQSVDVDMAETTATMAIHHLSLYLSRHYHKKVIILLDEYDTPMQEAYVNGYWSELVSFTRSLFNATFKTNPYLERAVMTGIACPALSGITRVSKESIFFDLNNLEVVTTTSEKYADQFGFTESEVFSALERYDLSAKKQEVKAWYDGFTFGGKKEIYNPWSILHYLDKRRVGTYWVNSSANRLVEKLIREGSPEIKMVMEKLLQGDVFHTAFDEQVVFDQLGQGDDAVWSLLLASGYLKAEHAEFDQTSGKTNYTLKLTNREVYIMFQQMVESWSKGCRPLQNAFLQALFSHDLDGMNEYMNDISSAMFSSFDTGKGPSSKAQPERFYHGFVLGLLVELRDRYTISSNKESGLGRYDILLEPLDKGSDAFIIEFKVVHTKRGETLEGAVTAALEQIERMGYERVLLEKGFAPERIWKYGSAFKGKEVSIGDRQSTGPTP